MLEDLKRQVLEANLALPKYNLVTFTWGNVSGLDRDRGLFVIKPSGVPYEELTGDDMVVMDLSGKKIEGKMNPSSDTPSHAELYRRFEGVNGIVHTHSHYATVWAQAGRDIPPYGTTHADYFYGPIPCCRLLTQDEVEEAYELNSGKVIADHFEKNKINPLHLPAALLKSHGPFAWGADAHMALHNAVVLEEVARMALETELLMDKKNKRPMAQYVLDKHFLRKHGPGAYYGQGKS